MTATTGRAESLDAALRRLVETGRAEMRAAELEAERAAAEKLHNARTARAAVCREIAAAIRKTGQVPDVLFAFMEPAGLNDDGSCENGYVTVTIHMPGTMCPVSFNVNEGEGCWYVDQSKWIGTDPAGGTVALRTFAQAVALSVAAANERRKDAPALPTCARCGERFTPPTPEYATHPGRVCGSCADDLRQEADAEAGAAAAAAEGPGEPTTDLF